VSQSRAPLSPNQKCERFYTLPRFPRLSSAGRDMRVMDRSLFEYAEDSRLRPTTIDEWGMWQPALLGQNGRCGAMSSAEAKLTKF
jgi:hypothetical protein